MLTQRVQNRNIQFTTCTSLSVTGAELYIKVLNADKKGTPVITCDGYSCDGFVWAYHAPVWADDRPVVIWHYPGHGQSSQPINPLDITIETLAADLQGVADRLGYQQYIPVGFSMGVQVCVEAWRQYRQNIAGYVMLCGSPGHLIETFHQRADRERPGTIFNTLFKAAFPHLISTARKHHEPWHQRAWQLIAAHPLSYWLTSHLEIEGRRVLYRDFFPYLKHLSNMQIDILLSTAEAAATHTADDILSSIDVPMLVFAGKKDRFVPYWRSVEMAEQVPHSELHLFEDATHVLPIEYPEAVRDMAHGFLNELDKETTS